MLRNVALLISLSLLAGCAAPNAKGDQLTATLETYAATIRWGNIEDAIAFVDPDVLKEHPLTELDLQRYRQVRISGYNAQPLTELDLQRYRQVRISGYNAQPSRPLGDNEISQIVEIVVTNNNTQSVRSVLDRQHWRYDDKKKRWWLTSGLPDITQH